MPTVRINCDGGLGNRFGAVIGGLRAAWALGFDPVLHWLRNENCGARLEDLFSGIPARMDDSPPDTSWPLVTHYPWEGRTNLPSSAWRDMTGDFEYNHSHWEGSGSDVLSHFTVQPEIQAHVDAFIKEHGVDRSWTGIHVRGTDNRHGGALEKAWKTVRQGGKVFLCSDDRDVEAQFAGHVLLHPKTAWVEKRIPGADWRIPPTDGTDCHCYNVVRSREATIQALQDALILARTTFSCPGSTFCKLAQAL